MNRILIIVSILLITTSFCSTKNNITNYKSSLKDSIGIYGDWQIFKYAAGYISEITEEDAQKYIGKVVILKPTLASVINDTCSQPFFKSITQSSDKYFYENNRADKAILKITEDSIRIVQLSCKIQPEYSSQDSLNFSYDFLVIDKNLLIISFKGFYFYLKRVK